MHIPPYFFSGFPGPMGLQEPKTVLKGFTTRNNSSDKVDLLCAKIVQQKYTLNFLLVLLSANERAFLSMYLGNTTEGMYRGPFYKSAHAMGKENR